MTAEDDLIKQGLKQTPVADLKPGWTVAYWDTDVFQLETVGGVLFGTIYKTRHDPDGGSIWVEHVGVGGDNTTQCDEGDTVWAKAEE